MAGVVMHARCCCGSSMMTHSVRLVEIDGDESVGGSLLCRSSDTRSRSLRGHDIVAFDQKEVPFQYFATDLQTQRAQADDISALDVQGLHCECVGEHKYHGFGDGLALALAV